MITRISIGIGFVFASLLTPTICLASDDSQTNYQVRSDILTWDTVGADDLGQFVGDAFSVVTLSRQSFDMEIDEVIPGEADPNRPPTLSRRRSVIVLFKIAEEDQDKLKSFEPQVISLWHPVLGQGHGYVSKTKSADGDPQIELILN